MTDQYLTIFFSAKTFLNSHGDNTCLHLLFFLKTFLLTLTHRTTVKAAISKDSTNSKHMTSSFDGCSWQKEYLKFIHYGLLHDKKTDVA